MNKCLVDTEKEVPLGAGPQQSVGVAAVTLGQGLTAATAASHTSMPAQPSRPIAMATAAPIKKPTPPPPTTTNTTSSLSVPTPSPSVTPTNTNSNMNTMVPSPIISPVPQPQTSVNTFPNPSTPTVPSDPVTLNQSADLLQPYNSLGINLSVKLKKNSYVTHYSLFKASITFSNFILRQID